MSYVSIVRVRVVVPAPSLCGCWMERFDDSTVWQTLSLYGDLGIHGGEGGVIYLSPAH
jgi:hypothetical protein